LPKGLREKTFANNLDLYLWSHKRLELINSKLKAWPECRIEEFIWLNIENRIVQNSMNSTANQAYYCQSKMLKQREQINLLSFFLNLIAAD